MEAKGSDALPSVQCWSLTPALSVPGLRDNWYDLCKTLAWLESADLFAAALQLPESWLALPSASDCSSLWS